MKTATIKIHHVFGTKGTVFAGVYYRGKQLRYRMENKNINDMLKDAREWAFSHGFTHTKIED